MSPAKYLKNTGINNDHDSYNNKRNDTAPSGMVILVDVTWMLVVEAEVWRL